MGEESTPVETGKRSKASIDAGCDGDKEEAASGKM